MKLDRLTFVVAVSLSLACASQSWGQVPGKGKSGCYVEWQVGAATSSKISCMDGDSACDADGLADGQCTFAVSVCAFQSNLSSCTPAPVNAITLKGKALQAGIQLPSVPVSAATCGATTNVTLPLRATKRGIPKNSKGLTLLVKAATSGKPKNGSSKVKLTCTPNRTSTPCPKNSSGDTEPNEVRFTVIDKGTDLDNGWTGASQNFPTPAGTKLQMCLDGCDSKTKNTCISTILTGPNTFNKGTFGPPLPLFAANLPICVMNRYAPQQAQGTADIMTGVVIGPIHLLSDVFLTDETHVCPRCETGTCDSGLNQGKPCAVDGEVTISQAATSNKHFKLSKDCPPPNDLLAGTLVINLPLTTGTSTLSPLPGGSTATPCVAQATEPLGLRPKADNCGAGTCTATCTGQACVDPNGKDYTTGATVCVDSKGGLSQFCCSIRTDVQCLPSDPDSGGVISRTGSPRVPQPPWPDPTYPKKTTCDAPGQCLVQVATFCEPATGTGSVDTLTGLPGPGALILPVTTEWLTPIQ